MTMSGYSYSEKVELAALALNDCKGALGPAVDQLRSLFLDLTPTGAGCLVKEARGYQLGLQLREIQRSLLRALSEQHAKRNSYPDLSWAPAELKFMLCETNTWRALLGKMPVDIRTIERVETWASGHCDYANKFAHYCAEIVLDTGPGVP